MKRIFLMTVAIFLVSSLLIFAADYKDGLYIGVVPGRDVTVVEVGITNGIIVEVNIVSPVKLEATYNFGPGIDAFIEYPGKVLAQQNTEIDAVAGATGSYQDYNKAVQMALDIASGKYKGNKYYGLAKDFAHGHVLIEITVEGKKVTDLQFITNDSGSNRVTLMGPKNESYPYGPARELFSSFKDKALAAIAAGKNEVDVVTGATSSSHSFNAALKHALSQAGL
ncbi:MAG: FMN-binding protein [Halanaerobiales bacterium]